MATETDKAGITVHQKNHYCRDDQGYEADGESRSLGSHDDRITRIRGDVDANDDDDDDNNSTLVVGVSHKHPRNNKRSFFLVANDVLYLARKRRRVARFSKNNREHNPFRVDVRMVKHMHAAAFERCYYNKKQSRRHIDKDNWCVLGGGNDDDDDRPVGTCSPSHYYLSQLHQALKASSTHYAPANRNTHMQKQQQQQLRLAAQPPMQCSSQPVHVEHALTFSSRPRVLIEAVQPFRVVHANAAYHARQERGQESSASSSSSGTVAASSSTTTAYCLEAAIRSRFPDPLRPVMIHPVWGEGTRTIAFYLVEELVVLSDDNDHSSDNKNNNNCQEVESQTPNAMLRRTEHSTPARVVA